LVNQPDVVHAQPIGINDQAKPLTSRLSHADGAGWELCHKPFL
jgi:hypothetical protein